jgi:L,D-peptidoglycan transpeptidase YkuD (ErfK/YbiS/YcfS/YnhG family)
MRHISPISVALTGALLTLLAAPAMATTYCPRVLHRATRLIIVTVPTMDATGAKMRTFARKSPSASWTPQGTAETAVVGAQGIAWGHPYASYAKRGEPIKKEGDQRSPAGLYRLGATFGFAKDDQKGHLQLRPGAQFCVHDPKSPLYGRIVSKDKAGAKTGGEDMGTFALYKRGIVVDYAPRRQAKAGSCIFVHIWGGEGVGTAGCVALPVERVAHLQEWTKGRHAVIAILSEDTMGRFGRCLPSGVSADKGPVVLPQRKPERADAHVGQRAALAR